MTAGILLIVGAVLIVWAFYRSVQKVNASTRLRFWVPGKGFESGDFWSIGKWVVPLVLIGLLLIWGGLPSIGGGGGAPPASPSTSTTGAPQAQDSPPPDAVVHEGTPYFRSYANWYSEAGDSCAGDGCKAGAYLAAQRRLVQ